MKLKKFTKGFTLSEVLITLAIIGVVAALTIPSLIQKVQTQQYRSAWKKQYTLISQAILNYKEKNDGSLLGTNILNDIDHLAREYATVIQSAKQCQYQAGCWHLNNNWYDFSGNPMNQTSSTGLILPDGTLMTVSINNSNCNDVSYGTPMGAGICAMSWVDVNGFKGPNKIGYDIYGIWIQKNTVSPIGTQGDLYAGATNCQIPNNGRGCGAKYLTQ